MLRAFFAATFLFVATAAAQTPFLLPGTNPVLDNAIKQLKPTFGLGPFRVVPGSVRIVNGPPPGMASPRCSVRLAEMEIPRDKAFTMQTSPVAKSFVSEMPEVTLPAPPCPKESR